MAAPRRSVDHRRRDLREPRVLRGTTPALSRTRLRRGLRKGESMKARKKRRKPLQIGERFGQWTVISSAVYPRPFTAHYKCKCDCGRDAFVASGNLLTGRTTRCASCMFADMRRRSSHSRRLVNVPCRECGRERMVPHNRREHLEPKCMSCARTDRAWKYPLSTGTIARRLGISRQAVWLQVKKRGWAFVASRYRKHIRNSKAA